MRTRYLVRILMPSLVFLISSILMHTVSAQVTIFSENFNGYPNGTTSGSGWSAGPAGQCDGNIGQWGVFGGQFVATDVEGFNCCPCAGGPPNNCGDNQSSVSFGPFDISSYCDVSLSFLFGASGGMECVTGCVGSPPTGCVGNGHDQAVFNYSVDGGAPVQFGYYCGSILCSGGTAIAGINGSSFSFSISMGNQAIVTFVYKKSN